jgi:DNA-binding MarR family transcriptional regulator
MGPLLFWVPGFEPVIAPFYDCFMDALLPLSTLLSQALVAFIIEFDNEFEHRMPHSTTNQGVSGPPGWPHPWLISMVMWMNCLRFVSEEGITVRELKQIARTETNLHGMQRWGYVAIQPNPADKGPKPAQADWLIRTTAAGNMAQEKLRPLAGEIEKRWQERFGTEEIGQLREALIAVVRNLDAGLPDCLPILGDGLSNLERGDTEKASTEKKRGKTKGGEPDQTNLASIDDSALTSLPLSSLLSRVLLAFAIEFERASEVSLAIGANILRLIGDRGVRVRDLPRLAGVSKESIATALSFLEKRGCGTVKPEAQSSKAKALTLTAKGKLACEKYQRLIGAIDEDWKNRFGAQTMHSLREALEQLVGDATANSPLFGGLKPYPDGWRALLPKPETLPHFPMVLHRGGFPDGS